MDVGTNRYGAITTSESQNCYTSGAKKNFNLPKLEFGQFDEKIKGWILFWSQFRHTYDDEDMTLDKKFHCPVPATISGSRNCRKLSANRSQ